MGKTINKTNKIRGLKKTAKLLLFERKQIAIYVQLFRERLSEKMCTQQSRKAIWDMINKLFLTL